MSDLLNRLGYLQTRRDRTPNLDLARDLVARDDKAGIREIAENMWNDNKNIHSDCINVMYEIAIIDPNLVTPYAADFIKFLKSKYSNMVNPWGRLVIFNRILIAPPCVRSISNASRCFELAASCC